jgi:hypothetical protein
MATRYPNWYDAIWEDWLQIEGGMGSAHPDAGSVTRGGLRQSNNPEIDVTTADADTLKGQFWDKHLKPHRGVLEGLDPNLRTLVSRFIGNTGWAHRKDVVNEIRRGNIKDVASFQEWAGPRYEEIYEATKDKYDYGPEVLEAWKGRLEIGQGDSNIMESEAQVMPDKTTPTNSPAPQGPTPDPGTEIWKQYFSGVNPSDAQDVVDQSAYNNAQRRDMMDALMSMDAPAPKEKLRNPYDNDFVWAGAVLGNRHWDALKESRSIEEYNAQIDHDNSMNVLDFEARRLQMRELQLQNQARGVAEGVAASGGDIGPSLQSGGPRREGEQPIGAEKVLPPSGQLDGNPFVTGGVDPVTGAKTTVFNPGVKVENWKSEEQKQDAEDLGTTYYNEDRSSRGGAFALSRIDQLYQAYIKDPEKFKPAHFEALADARFQYLNNTSVDGMTGGPQRYFDGNYGMWWDRMEKQFKADPSTGLAPPDNRSKVEKWMDNLGEIIGLTGGPKEGGTSRAEEVVRSNAADPKQLSTERVNGVQVRSGMTADHITPQSGFFEGSLAGGYIDPQEKDAMIGMGLMNAQQTTGSGIINSGQKQSMANTAGVLQDNVTREFDSGSGNSNGLVGLAFTENGNLRTQARWLGDAQKWINEYELDEANESAEANLVRFLKTVHPSKRAAILTPLFQSIRKSPDSHEFLQTGQFKNNLPIGYR